MSELVVGSIAGLAANSYEVSVASGSTLDLANAKAGSLPDTALNAVPGMDLIASFDVSGASTHSFGDDASPLFTSDYTTYKVILTNVQADGSSNIEVNLRLTANGTPLTGSNYNRQTFYADGPFLAGGRTSSQTSLVIFNMGYLTDNYTLGELTITNPNVAKFTKFMTHSNYTLSGTGLLYLAYVGNTDETGIYNGFQLFSTNTFSAKLSVYGMKEA